MEQIAAPEVFLKVENLPGGMAMGIVFFDIVPVSDGWAVMVNGRWTGSYASRQLALAAAESAKPEARKADGEVVMRELDISGRLRPRLANNAAA